MVLKNMPYLDGSRSKAKSVNSTKFSSIWKTNPTEKPTPTGDYPKKSETELYSPNTI